MNIKQLLLVFACIVTSFGEKPFEEIETTPYRGWLTSKYDYSTYNYVTFALKACGVAHMKIGLRKQFPASSIVTIDTHQNMVLMFPPTTKMARRPKMRQKTRPLNDCDEFKVYYVKWTRGPHAQLEFGTADEKRITIKDAFELVSERLSVKSAGEDASWEIFDPKVSPKNCCQSGHVRRCSVAQLKCQFFTQTDGSYTDLKRCPPGQFFNLQRCKCDTVDVTACKL